MNTSFDHVTKRGEDGEILLRTTLKYIRMCFLPIVLAGTVTNVLNFVVLSNKQMQRLSTSVYLLALAIADVGVMYFELFRVWFEWMDIAKPEDYFTKPYCKFANFTNGFFRDYSNWLIACLAVERLIMVANPYRARVWCTIRNARWTCFVLAICICLGHLHCLVLSVPIKKVRWVCWEDTNIPNAANITAIFEFMFGYTVVIVVFLLNIILVMMLYRTQFSCLPGACRPQDGRLMRHHGRRLTRTLLLIAFVFLVCETPRVIVSVISKAQRTFTIRVTLNISFVISGINHACNFFIYILSSPRFRTVFFDTVPWCYCCLPKSTHCDVMIIPADAWQNERRVDDRRHTHMCANNRSSHREHHLPANSPDEVTFL